MRAGEGRTGQKGMRGEKASAGGRSYTKTRTTDTDLGETRENGFHHPPNINLAQTNKDYAIKRHSEIHIVKKEKKKTLKNERETQDRLSSTSAQPRSQAVN